MEATAKVKQIKKVPTGIKGLDDITFGGLPYGRSTLISGYAGSGKTVGIDLNKYGKYLFAPFSRFSSQAEGLGIGLHIANTMVKRNGGYIEVSSIPGEGTIFSVCLKEKFNTK